MKALEHAGFRSLPALDRPLTVISSFDDDLSDSERLSLGEALDRPTLIRFRVQARPYLDMRANSQERVTLLRADQIKGVNDLLSEKIEIVT